MLIFCAGPWNKHFIMTSSFTYVVGQADSLKKFTNTVPVIWKLIEYLEVNNIPARNS